MTDTIDNVTLFTAISSERFQVRCRMRFLVAAVAVTNEVVAATVNATTAAGNPTLHFAATPAGIVGYTVADLTTPAAIGAGNTVLSTTGTTATMAANALAPGVGATDVITFTPPSHTQRLAFAGALFNNAVNPATLAKLVLTNAANRTNCLGRATVSGVTATGNATLNFASVPVGIVGATVADLTTPGAISASATIISATATTAVMSAAALAPGVGAADVIQFGIAEPGGYILDSDMDFHINSIFTGIAVSRAWT